MLHALELGYTPEDVVYDSPCKTVGEIKFALQKGVHLNMDNMQELARVGVLNDSSVHESSYSSCPCCVS